MVLTQYYIIMSLEILTVHWVNNCQGLRSVEREPCRDRLVLRKHFLYRITIEFLSPYSNSESPPTALA